MKNTVLIALLLFLNSGNLLATAYYVDFESGNDNNPGTAQETAWEHAPGDSNAEGIPAAIELLPGDIIYFKGGVVYRGNIVLGFSGDSLNPITYKGDGWGAEQAIIDGSESVAGWTALNGNIYYADIPASYSLGETSGALNLHEYNNTTGEDEYMWTAQWPNPEDWFFYDEHNGFHPVSNDNITLTSITDSEVFNQTDENYWNNSSLIIWTNPNRVVLRKITSYSPASNTVYFDALHDEAIYPDGRDQGYAIYNSIHALDQPGEYHVNFEEGRIYIYPRNPANIESSVSCSVREFGFNISSQSGIAIEGFTIRKHSGDNLRSGIGIGSYSAAHIDKEHYFVRNNHIYHNRHSDRGYGGIYLGNISNSIIENNLLEENFRHRGIFCSGGSNVIVTNNTIRRSGSTSLTFYSMRNSQITYNSVIESQGGHANGITLYIASKDILVASNKVIDCASPITFQDGGNFYFINNLVDSKDNEYGVNEWGRTSRGPWDWGEIVFLNNTFLSVPGTSALNIERSLTTFDADGVTIYPNTYFSYNNIIDAGGGNTDTQRDYNLYTSLGWNQRDRYDWYLADNEIVEENRELIFQNPSQEDYRLSENSPARAAGTTVTHLIPFNKFPDFNFYADINRYPRPQSSPWSIGAYEYGSVETPDPGNSDDNQVIVYPNPNFGVLNINASGATHYEIVKINGQSLCKETLVDNEINMNHYANGIYIVKIFGDLGLIASEKVVLNK